MNHQGSLLRRSAFLFLFFTSYFLLSATYAVDYAQDTSSMNSTLIQDSEGYGNSKNEAFENAILNALTKANGSLVDSETTHSRESTQSGRSYQSKSKTSKSILMYSRSTPLKATVIEASENNGIWRVVADVLVKLER
jgi:hypothetical protein